MCCFVMNIFSEVTSLVCYCFPQFWQSFGFFEMLITLQSAEGKCIIWCFDTNRHDELRYLQ